MREAVLAAECPVVAVSPIISGQAVKGPAAKIMTELGYHPSWETIAHHYAGLAGGMIIDRSEIRRGEANLPLMVETDSIIMKSLDDRRRLGQTVLNFAERLRG
jgi:LPPG:FO 2-phospho-L-lactate transferase